MTGIEKIGGDYAVRYIGEVVDEHTGLPADVVDVLTAVRNGDGETWLAIRRYSGSDAIEAARQYVETQITAKRT